MPVCIDAQKGPFYYPQNMFQFQICYYAYLHVSQKKENYHKFQGSSLVPCKVLVKDLILPHKYHASNFYRRFRHTLVT